MWGNIDSGNNFRHLPTNIRTKIYAKQFTCGSFPVRYYCVFPCWKNTWVRNRTNDTWPVSAAGMRVAVSRHPRRVWISETSCYRWYKRPAELRWVWKFIIWNEMFFFFFSLKMEIIFRKTENAIETQTGPGATCRGDTVKRNECRW